jgi:polyhydroxyalkanoate synthesis regulator phasin
VRRPEGLKAWLERSGEAVREDARRALAELVARGDLSAEEARAIEQAVAGALERSAGFVAEHVLEPARGLLRAATAAGGARLDELAARLDALSERLERLEQRLSREAEDGDEREPPCS